MTTYARKIAEAVRDAAALEANKCYIKSTSLFELGVEAAKAVRALDLDAIIAGVPQPEPEALVLERDLLKFQVERIKEVATSIHNFAHDKSAGPAVPDALWEVRSMAAQIINDECLTADISTEQCDALTQPQAAEPVDDCSASLPFAILHDEMAALKRFDECVTDGEGYDVPKEMMKRLSEIGLVRRVTANVYEHTNFGLAVLNGDFAPQPQVVEPKGLTDEQRIGTAAIKDGRVCSYTFEQTDIPDGSYWLYATPQPSQPAASEAARDVPARRFRHVKTGGIYTLLSGALSEATKEPLIVYRSEETGVIWVRPAKEFDDGRFAEIERLGRAEGG